jgi:hypothetical protein
MCGVRSREKQTIQGVALLGGERRGKEWRKEQEGQYPHDDVSGEMRAAAGDLQVM